MPPEQVTLSFNFSRNLRLSEVKGPCEVSLWRRVAGVGWADSSTVFPNLFWERCRNKAVAGSGHPLQSNGSMDFNRSLHSYQRQFLCIR